ncbi:TIGR03621 family F420-dependent LLM class oxidoreductase [Amycolatopsis tucumanensis]|uniref:TIGR03621 family F420-dependent LLM class oxidoreductase n=1 Tax=Amycolatopsis tucumanensis TaxID=401106 RepID=A0ABP7IL19_9PSEU|nr:TIGR03621 family F420-dependent LLM class oxidoreductase [Amycolatopsis tucumanensis]MCF6422924.1 TIGR03621 family F420-dependent LLM class oxidoreductase [Amycolatopsis tucumanensis]
MNDYRFGVSLRFLTGRDDWAAKCRRAEELGYDTITIPDHLGMPAPFPALVAAAQATERVRVGHMVLNAPFYNPVLLAREVASTALLTAGRLDVGLGSGHMKSEFDDAGLPFAPPAERIKHLARTIEVLRDRLDDAPPLLIAGNSDGVLRLAAEHADIVGFAGLKHARGYPLGTFDLASAAELDDRVGFFRERAGDRQVQHNMLIQNVVVADDPVPALEEWLAGVPSELGWSAARLVDAPQMLAGTPEQIAAKIRAMRERYGFTYFTVFEMAMEEFAPVIPLLRA